MRSRQSRFTEKRQFCKSGDKRFNHFTKNCSFVCKPQKKNE